VTQLKAVFHIVDPYCHDLDDTSPKWVARARYAEGHTPSFCASWCGKIG
jgi:hypothetical protein